MQDQLGCSAKLNERTDLLHVPKRGCIEDICKSYEGFDPRNGRQGEYGKGVYFAEHALYCIAYAEGWLDSNSKVANEQKRVAIARNEEIVLLWSRVILGECKDWDAKCRSARCPQEHAQKAWDGWPERDIEQGKPPRKPRGSFGGTPVIRRYNSVTGTEGDLQWAADSTLRQNKHITDVGRQFVVYDGNQAYPEYLIRVRRTVPGGCKP